MTSQESALLNGLRCKLESARILAAAGVELNMVSAVKDVTGNDRFELSGADVEDGSQWLEEAKNCLSRIVRDLIASACEDADEIEP